MDDNHDCTIVMERYNDGHPMDISLTFYKRISWADYYGKDNFLSRWIKRIQCSLKMLFTGYIELEEEFLIEDEEHIDSFIKALQEGKQMLQ